MAKTSPWRRVLLFLFICFCLQEVVFRIFFPLPAVRPFNRSLYIPSIGGMVDYKAIRSIDVVWHSAPDGVSFTSRLNRYGFRDRTWERETAPGTTRVAFVGDSYTEGLMAPGDQTIPAGFEGTALQQGWSVEAMNLGLGGIGVRHYLPLLIDMLPVFRPQQVVLVVFANDLGAGCAPQLRVPKPPVVWPCWKPRLWELVSILRAGECLPARYNFISRPFFFPLPQEGNPWNDYLTRVEKVCRADITAAVKAGHFPPMRIGGSSYLEEQLREDFDLRPSLTQVKSYCAFYESRLAVAYLPDRSMVTNYYKQFDAALATPSEVAIDLTGERYHRHRRLLAEQCAELDIPFHDLTEWVAAHERAGRHLYWHYDDHMRGSSYLEVGAKLCHWLLALGQQ